MTHNGITISGLVFRKIDGTYICGISKDTEHVWYWDGTEFAIYNASQSGWAQEFKVAVGFTGYIDYIQHMDELSEDDINYRAVPAEP